MAADLLQHALFMVLTVGIYLPCLWLFRHCHQRVLLHPLSSACVLLALVLWALNIDYANYQEGNRLFYWLLGPSTVALAVPLHQQFDRIRLLAQPLLLTLLVGLLAAPLCALSVAWLLGAEPATLLAMAPKSVTTPIALGIATEIGAIGELTAGVVIFTGVVGALAGPGLLARLGLRDPRLVGFTLGINAHGVGTARAFEIDPLCGAFASLALGLTGALTALTLPTVVLWLGQ